jgi:hypothetical protein
MTVMTVAIIASAAPTDRDFTTGPSSWHGWTHAIAFLVIVVCSIVTPLVTARALRGEDRWRPLARVSAAAAGICAASMFLVVVSQLGFYLFLITVFGWYTALALRFLRLTTG